MNVFGKLKSKDYKENAKRTLTMIDLGFDNETINHLLGLKKSGKRSHVLEAEHLKYQNYLYDKALTEKVEINLFERTVKKIKDLFVSGSI